MRFLNLRELFCIRSQEVVQLSNQAFHSRNELNKTFGDKNRTEVIALCSTIGNHLCNVGYYIIQRHIFRFYFFRNDTYVRLNLQSTFQCNVRSRTTHQFDKVPVFAGRITVALDVSNHF